jgi:hypothetical protein
MTLVQALRALGRRWYVVLVGAMLTAAAALAATQVGGVYTARTEVRFVPPVGWAVAGNTFTDSAASLVGFARLVEQTMTDGVGGQVFAAPETPLYGSGARDAAMIYVPNFGGQWAPNYNQPEIVVDVVGASPGEVDERVRALTARVAEVVDERQDEMGVAADQRITTYANPAVPEVSYAGANRTRALAGIAILGAGLSVAAALVTDRVLRRRQAVAAARAVLSRSAAAP